MGDHNKDHTPAARLGEGTPKKGGQNPAPSTPRPSTHVGATSPALSEPTKPDAPDEAWLCYVPGGGGPGGIGIWMHVPRTATWSDGIPYVPAAKLEAAEAGGPLGQWRCDVCKFFLVTQVIDVSAGRIGAPKIEQVPDCSNGCGPMRRETWEECARGVGATVDRLHEICDDRDATIADLKAKVEAVEAELETESMRVVACGVAAMANTEKSKADRIGRDNPYWTTSYGDVCKAVDREIALCDERDAFKAVVERLTKIIGEQTTLLHEMKKIESEAVLLAGVATSALAGDGG